MNRTWALAFLLVPAVLAAQTEPTPEAFGGGGMDRTQVPASSRYEVFRTFGVVSLALKLDKYEGVVYELAPNRGYMKGKDDQFAWQKTRRMTHPQDTGRISSHVNYQIVASRVGPLLVNIQTGAAWLLARDPGKDEAYWYPIPPQGGIARDGE